MSKDTPSIPPQEHLLRELYQELRLLAAQKMCGEMGPQTLQPTALVHEAYLKLSEGNADQRWNGRGHFFASAAEAMRRILIDVARRKAAAKRGARATHEELDENLAMPAPPEQCLEVGEALEKLREVDPDAAHLVELMFFAGMTVAETASLIGCGTATVKRRWAHTRAWLHREIETQRKEATDPPQNS